MDWGLYAKHIDSLERVAKAGAAQDFEHSGAVHPTAIVLSTRDPETGHSTPVTPIIIPLNFASDEAKDETVALLHQFIARSEATAIALISEIWKTTFESIPQRTEHVMIHLETLLGTRALTAQILRHPETELEGFSEGRMAGFIKPISSGAN